VERPVVGGIRAADHAVPRSHPCVARNLPPLPASACGATPTRPWRRTCPNNHDDRVWLCDPHASIFLTSPAHCGACLARGGTVEASLTPDLEAAR
jgi:hypothetical protein